MLLCELLVRNILHYAKIPKLWIYTKLFCVRYQTNYDLIRLFSFTSRKTFMNRCYSLNKCHSFEKNSNAEQEILSKNASENSQQDQVLNDKVKILFETAKGERIECLACLNQNVMNVSIENDVAMHGNCNGEAICSVCHVYIDEKYQEFMPKISEEEAEMLDMVPNLQENSRLSCQIIIKKELKGAVFKLPHYDGPSYENPN